VFAARIAFPATAGPFRKWDGALSVFPTPTPTPTPIFTAEPATCMGTVIASTDLNVRAEPWGVRIGTLRPGEVVNIIGQYQRPDEGDVWYYVSSAGSSGFVAGWYLQGTDCPLTLPQRPPVTRTYDLAVACQLIVPEAVSLSSYRLSPARGALVIVDSQPVTLDASRTITIYGRSLQRIGEFYYLITHPVPGVSTATWRWISSAVTTFREVNPNLTNCNYNVLPGYPVPTGNEDDNFARALNVYTNDFSSPVNPTDRPYGRNSSPFQDTQHNGIDIVVRRVQGGSSEPFTVVAPYNGVIVDAGPDGFVGTFKVEATFASIDQIQPQWVRDCVQNTGERTSALICRPGTWIDVTRPDPNSTTVHVFLMYVRAAWSYGRSTDEYKLNVRNDGWLGQDYGLDLDQAAEMGSFGYSSLCGGDLVSCNSPGQQLMIVYDIDGSDSGCAVLPADCVPEIRTVLLHTRYLNPDWRTACSGSPSMTGQADIYARSRQNPVCYVATGTVLGTASDIGYSSGPHLHYSVYVDQNSNGIFYAEDTFNEAIDPLIARAMTR